MALTTRQRQALEDAAMNEGKLFQLPEKRRHAPSVLTALVKQGLLKTESVGVIWTLTQAGRERLASTN